jgi:hypothetical protein
MGTAVVGIEQITLGLEPTVNPASESALRAAYKRLELSRRLRFEEAMADPAYAIGIRNLAEAMARRICRSGSSRRSSFHGHRR